MKSYAKTTTDRAWFSRLLQHPARSLLEKNLCKLLVQFILTTSDDTPVTEPTVSKYYKNMLEHWSNIFPCPQFTLLTAHCDEDTPFFCLSARLAH